MVTQYSGVQYEVVARSGRHLALSAGDHLLQPVPDAGGAGQAAHRETRHTPTLR